MDKKSEQLGINYSTATARLDRMVLFRLIQKLGENQCFRCGEIIERYQDLSLEHKEAWQDSLVTRLDFFGILTIWPGLIRDAIQWQRGGPDQ